MRKLGVLIALLLFTAYASATIGTYTGETEKEGPEAEYVVGFASDRPATLQLELEKMEGLNFSYEEEVDFRPEDASRHVLRGGERLALKELNIVVESEDPVKEVYEVPVTLRAFRPENLSEGVTPRVIHEREYVLSYRTQISPEHGYEGDLVEPDREEDREPDESINISEENTITGENNTKVREEGEESARDTLLLTAAVILVFGYTVYEAFT
ncbi:MAG: hypothetical protein ACLFTA_03380 [Candidatus Nanohaloarchaea archaeon]